MSRPVYLLISITQSHDFICELKLAESQPLTLMNGSFASLQHLVILHSYVFCFQTSPTPQSEEPSPTAEVVRYRSYTI